MGSNEQSVALSSVHPLLVTRIPQVLEGSSAIAIPLVTLPAEALPQLPGEQRGQFSKYPRLPLHRQYVRSFWPKDEDRELVKFLDMLISGGAVKFQYSIFNCIDKSDVRRVAQEVLSMAGRVGPTGHNALDTMLEALPPSTAKDAVVRREIEQRFDLIRNSLQRESQRPRNAGMRSSADAKSKSLWGSLRDLPPPPETARHDAIMELLFEHPVLSQSLSSQERAALWELIVSDTQREIPTFSLIDAELERQFDPLSEEHLASHFRELLSAGRVIVLESQVQKDDSATDFKDLEHSSYEYTTADVEHAVSSLGSTARSALAAGLVRDTCQAERPNPVALMMSALAAAVGDRWDSQPWTSVRLGLLNLPITVGDPTDVLFGGRPIPSYSGHFQQPWNDRGFWKSLEQFRRDHGLNQANLDKVTADCSALTTR